MLYLIQLSDDRLLPRLVVDAESIDGDAAGKIDILFSRGGNEFRPVPRCDVRLKTVVRIGNKLLVEML